MNIERLNLMVTLLEEVQQAIGHNDMEAKYFRMVGWGTDECGTAGCACGLAGRDPRFQAVGFKMGPNMPEYDGYKNWEAVCRFFDINMDQAYELFSYDGYEKELDTTFYNWPLRITPGMVIGHIKNMVGEQ